MSYQLKNDKKNILKTVLQLHKRMAKFTEKKIIMALNCSTLPKTMSKFKLYFSPPMLKYCILYNCHFCFTLHMKLNDLGHLSDSGDLKPYLLEHLPYNMQI